MPVIGEGKHVVIEDILFATDFSEASAAALTWAKALAKHYESNLRVVHVLKPDAEAETAMVSRKLEDLQSELSAEEIPSRAEVLHGRFVGNEIAKYGQQHRPGLIVVGTTGARKLERLLLGSTAESVLRHTRCPVVTVGPMVAPLPDTKLAMRRILFATDFNAWSAISALYALSVAAEHGSHISLCYVNPGPRTNTDAEMKLQAKFREELRSMVPEETMDWCTPEFVVERGDPADQIVHLARSRSADLIVLGEHPASGVSTHLPPGIAFRVIAAAPCPVLTIRSPRSSSWATVVI